MVSCIKIPTEPCKLVFFEDCDMLPETCHRIEALLTKRIGVECIFICCIDHASDAGAVETVVSEKKITTVYKDPEDESDDRNNHLSYRNLILESLLGFVLGFLFSRFLRL